MAAQAPPELLGIHSNMPGVIPPDIDKAAQSRAPLPPGLSADARLAYERLAFVYATGVAYGYDNVTLTWLTTTAISSARLYWSRVHGDGAGTFGFVSVKGVSIPVAVSVFPDELQPAPRSWAERAYISKAASLAEERSERQRHVDGLAKRRAGLHGGR